MAKTVPRRIDEFDSGRKFAAKNDLCKVFKDEAPDTARTSLMLAKLEEILTGLPTKGDR